MTLGLRKITQHATGQRIKLLSEQADIIAAQEQAGEQLARFRIAALQYVIVHEPKAAREERSFAGGQAVAAVFGLVAESKRGQHSQSIEPSRPTKAAVLQSPIRA
jgi:hypothetical protein